jgi:phospholipid transport system substrate-binding protein
MPCLTLLHKPTKTFAQAIFSLALVFSLPCLTPLANAQSAPDQLILNISQGVLDEIKADRSVQSGDINRLNNLVDKRVMPHVNFQRMTALSVGRNWRSASPEQQKILMAEFRRLLLLTYADAAHAFKA